MYISSFKSFIMVSMAFIGTRLFARSTVSAFVLPSLISSPHVNLHSSTQLHFARSWRAKLRKYKDGRLSMVMSPTDEVVTEKVEDEEERKAQILSKTEWNIPGLKKETEKHVLRCHKKIQKSSSKLNLAMQRLEILTSKKDATLEELEQCPDVDMIQQQVDRLKERLRDLNNLELMIQPLKKSEKNLSDEVKHLVAKLGLSDSPPPPQSRGGGKKKGPKAKEKTRLPYRRYYSKDNVEIRVGKQAVDNDELSTNPNFRDGTDWWMHASGCPGSHIVIRCGHQNLDNEVVMDAASLAARQSKCAGSTIKVSLTRCRNVSKPPGAKAGLVHLSGDVRTISVNMKEAGRRLSRLDKTMILN